eukprot:COSAG01_NODE_1159_length_11469_cov_15.000352_6_plen_186_part_00
MDERVQAGTYDPDSFDTEDPSAARGGIAAPAEMQNVLRPSPRRAGHAQSSHTHGRGASLGGTGAHRRRKQRALRGMSERERKEENRRLRGELLRLETEMAAVRSRLNEELDLKDQQLVAAHKELQRMQGAPPPERNLGCVRMRHLSYSAPQPWLAGWLPDRRDRVANSSRCWQVTTRVPPRRVGV